MLPLLPPHLVYPFEPLAVQRGKSEVARRRPSLGGWNKLVSDPARPASVHALRQAIRQAEQKAGHPFYEWPFWTHGLSYDGDGCAGREDCTYGFMAVYDWLVANDFDVTELLDTSGEVRADVMERWKQQVTDEPERFAWWLSTWMLHHRNFLARTLAQTDALYGDDEEPTNRHLNLIMWASSPDAEGLKQRVPAPREVGAWSYDDTRWQLDNPAIRRPRVPTRSPNLRSVKQPRPPMLDTFSLSPEMQAVPWPSGLNASQRETLEYVLGNTQGNLYDLLVQYSKPTVQQLPPRYEFIGMALRDLEQQGSDAVRCWLDALDRDQQLGLAHRLFDTFAVQTQGDVRTTVCEWAGDTRELSGRPAVGTLRHRKDGVYEWNGHRWVRTLSEDQAAALDFTVPGELTPSRFAQAVGTFARPLVRVGYSQKTAEKIAMAAAVLATSPLSVGLVVGLTVPGAQAAAAIPGAAEAALLVSGAMAFKNPVEALAMLAGGVDAARRVLSRLPHSVKDWQKERAESTKLLQRMQTEMQRVQTVAGGDEAESWWPDSLELLSEEHDPDGERATQLRLETRRRMPDTLLRRLNTLADERKLTKAQLDERLAPLVAAAPLAAYWHAVASGVLMEEDRANWRRIARYIRENWPLAPHEVGEPRSTGRRNDESEEADETTRTQTMLETLLAAMRTAGIPDDQHPTALLIVAELSRVAAQDGVLLNVSDPAMALALAEQVKELMAPGSGTLNGRTLGSIEHSDLEALMPHVTRRLNQLHDILEQEAKPRINGAINPWFMDALMHPLMEQVFGVRLAPASRYTEEYPGYVRLWLGELAQELGDYQPTADESPKAQGVAARVKHAPSVKALVDGTYTVYTDGLFQLQILPEYFRRWAAQGSATLEELAEDAANYVADIEHKGRTWLHEDAAARKMTPERFREIIDDLLDSAERLLRDTQAAENPIRRWMRAGERAQANLQLLAVEHGVPLAAINKAIRAALRVPSGQERGMHWVDGMTPLAIAQTVYLYEHTLYGEYDDGRTLAEQAGHHLLS